MIIETVDTAYLPLLKSISTTSSSYGTVAGDEFESAAAVTISEHTTSTTKQHTGILHRTAARDEEEKDNNIGGAGGRISPPSPLPPRHRASTSDGWSSGSLKKPPLVVRQTSSPTPHSVTKQLQQQQYSDTLFSEHDVSIKFTTKSVPRMSNEGGHHRRTNSEDIIKRTTSRHHRSGSRSGKNNSFSGGTLNFESIMLIPDPRWGGGGLYRTFSNDNQQKNDDNMVTDMVSYSTSTEDSGDPLGYWVEGSDYGYFGNNNQQQLVLDKPYPLRRSIPSLLPPPKKHRRFSISDVSNGSYDGSAEPAVTDKTKSVLYKGITNRGVVKLQLPKDNFRLLIDRDLESGCVYKRDLVENENVYFQEYHITIDTGVFEQQQQEQQHRPIRPPLLPPMYYVMCVDSDIYQRMLDEVSQSRSSPCGLFYFGHHKDVSYPSIAIAAVSLVIVFSLMLWATFYVNG
jgi:hypothetical protein